MLYPLEDPEKSVTSGRCWRGVAGWYHGSWALFLVAQWTVPLLKRLLSQSEQWQQAYEVYCTVFIPSASTFRFSVQPTKQTPTCRSWGGARSPGAAPPRCRTAGSSGRIVMTSLRGDASSPEQRPRACVPRRRCYGDAAAYALSPRGRLEARAVSGGALPPLRRSRGWRPWVGLWGGRSAAKCSQTVGSGQSTEIWEKKPGIWATQGDLGWKEGKK